MKTCTNCKQAKPHEEFHNNKNSKDGKQAYCKTCNKFRVRKWQSENTDRYHASWSTPEVKLRQRARTYGLSSQELLDLISKYAGICPICGREENLVVDHCHETGVVRGMLCSTCNKAIGMLGDNTAGVERAIRYLKGLW